MKRIQLSMITLASTMLLSGCHVVTVRHASPPIYVVHDRTIHHHTTRYPVVQTIHQQVIVQQQRPARPVPEKPHHRHTGQISSNAPHQRPSEARRPAPSLQRPPQTRPTPEHAPPGVRSEGRISTNTEPVSTTKPPRPGRYSPPDKPEKPSHKPRHPRDRKQAD